MLGEPLVAGLVLAPSPEGALLALAALGAFLARHPLKLALSDLRRGARYPRTVLAAQVAAAYVAVAGGSLVLFALRAPALAWLPLAAAAPLGALQLSYDARLQGRQLLPELTGAVALSATAAAVLLAGGWALEPAFTVWALLAVKGVAAVVYVRARLRRDRGLAASRGPALAAHAGGIVMAAALAAAGWAPRLAVFAFAVLLGRALHGLSGFHRVVRPQVVGFTELGLGILTTALLALGYAAGL